MQSTRRIRNINLLYLVSMLLVVSLGSVMQARSLRWGLIGTEILLILLPACLYLWYIDPPARERLRLRLPDRRSALGSVLIGLGLGLIAMFLDALAQELFGYTPYVPPDFYPLTAAEAVLHVAAFALAAPVCEEILFRGVIQPAYETRSARAGIVAGGLLFAFFHLRLQGLVSILPLAFAFGYLVQRSDSLPAGMLAHAATNTLSVAGVLLASVAPRNAVVTAVPVGALIAAGIVLTAAGFGLLRQAPEPAPGGLEGDARARGLGPAVVRYWPLLVAAVVYVVMAGVEYRTYAPHAPGHGIEWQTEAVVTPARWTYELRDLAGKPIGTAVYELDEIGDRYILSWRVEHEAFRTEVGSRSVYQSDAVTNTGWAAWDRATLRLVSLDAAVNVLSWSARAADSGVLLTAHAPGAPELRRTSPHHAFFPGEWPWRLAYVRFRLGMRDIVPMGWPWRWNPDTERSEPFVEEVRVEVTGGVPVRTPAGRFVAWQISVAGSPAAWYDVKPPHTLLRYVDGGVVYVLTARETGGTQL